MSLVTRIDKAVDSAFSKLDELAKDITFVKKTVSSFSFTQNSIVESAVETFTIRGFVTSATKRINGVAQLKTTVVIKTLPEDLSGYTKVTIDGITYDFTVSDTNDFVTTIDITRRI